MIIIAGDIVTFQVGINKIDGTKKAFNIIKKEKDLRKGKIDSIKSQVRIFRYFLIKNP
jgi:hypothetical protein